jgi:hypothetical protein
VGFYSRVIFPRLCDFLLDKPFVEKHRQELLSGVSGEILEIGFGTGLNLPHYPEHVREISVVDPNLGMGSGVFWEFSRNPKRKRGAVTDSLAMASGYDLQIILTSFLQMTPLPRALSPNCRNDIGSIGRRT